MSTGIKNGYILSNCQSLYINRDDCQKYGIKSEDWDKVDKNQDGLIDIGEILLNGKDISSINSAFKSLAISNNGYLNDAIHQNSSSSEYLSITDPRLGNNCHYFA